MGCWRLGIIIQLVLDPINTVDGALFVYQGALPSEGGSADCEKKYPRGFPLSLYRLFLVFDIAIRPSIAYTVEQVYLYR